MIVDTSAIAAVLLDEPDADRILLALSHHRTAISVASYLEIGIVLDSRGGQRGSSFDPLLTRMGITLVPVSAEQARLARTAHARFGRGSGHRARLNFGDCFVYALAMEMDEPILCKGSDFAQTDARIAAY